VRRSDSRLGLIENWRRSFATARELRPEARYFAWTSDHDVWHPEWLERLVQELEEHPEAVLAYPLNVGIDDHGTTVKEPWRFDTAGIGDTWQRLETSVRGMVPGDMAYGLYRAEPLAHCGVYHPVLLPDRLLLSELAVFGEFHQVPEVLWSRRYRSATKVSARRQRAAFFPGGAPVHAYLPWPLTHTAAIARDLVIRGAGRPRHGRLTGLAISAWYLVRSSALAIYRRARTIGHHAKKGLHAA
jgi:Glycosyl transferase family 2